MATYEEAGVNIHLGDECSKIAYNAAIKALAHITGGGLPGNVCRIFKGKNMGADLKNLPEVPAPFRKLQELGNVSDEEAFKTWNMGIGLVMVSNEFEKIREIAEKHGIKAYEIGKMQF